MEGEKNLRSPHHSLEKVDKRVAVAIVKEVPNKARQPLVTKRISID